MIINIGRMRKQLGCFSLEIKLSGEKWKITNDSLSQSCPRGELYRHPVFLRLNKYTQF
jgi:hypothetical protein